MTTVRSLYQALIHDFCRAAGIDRASEIVACEHIAIGERVIGLIPEEIAEAPKLSVYIEMGEATYPHRDGALYARMLGWNTDAPAQARGHFGIHPKGNQVVYCMRLDMDLIDGAALCALLETQLQLADDAMTRLSMHHEACSPSASNCHFPSRPGQG